MQHVPTYDHRPKRLFPFIPFWGFSAHLTYRPRRIDCPRHGIHVEHLPWADGKSSIYHPLRSFLAHWAILLSWKEVASQFRFSWHHVFESVKSIVDYGLKHRRLEDITAIGVDEIQYQRGHKYLALVYQIDSSCRHLLFIGKDRTVKTLLRFFYRLGANNASLYSKGMIV